MPIGVGLIISGACAYAFLALASHELTPSQYGPLATFWSLAFMLGPGSFGILERETGRRISVGLDSPRTDRKPLRDMRTFAVVEVLVLCGLLCFVHAQVATELFGGDNWIVLAAVIALPSIGTQYLTWGILAGNRKFRAYGTVNATEGFGRLIGGALLLAFGVRTAGGLSFVIALAPAASVLFVLRTLRGSERQEPDTGRNLKRRVLLWLLGSSLIQAFFINAGPLLIKLLAPSNSSLATGRFLSGLVLVRVPLFLYNAASAALLPPLAVAASRRHWGSFRSQLNRLLVVIGVIAGISVVFVVTLGTWVLGAVFGARYQLDRMTMLALALAASTLLVTTTLSVALTATGAVRYLFACWCSGVGTMLLTLLLFQGLFPRVEFSLLFGASVSAATMAAGLYLRAVPLHARGEVVEAEVLADIARTAEL